MELTGTRIIVTGGAGFIGSHVVDELLRRGNEVLVIDDFSTGRSANLEHHLGDPGLQVAEADVRDASAMDELIRDAEVVVHMAVGSLRASLSDPLSVHEINATGTLHVCRAADRNRVRRVVYVSSSEAYGSACYAPMDEAHPLVPTTVYGASKAAGELYVTSYANTYGLEVAVVRPFNTYGPREHADGTSAEVIPRFVMRVMAGLPPVVFGDGHQTRDFTWVEETARGIVLAAACDALVGGHINLARGREVSIREIARLVLHELDRPDLQPVYDEDRPGDVTRHYAAVDKAHELLGFEATVDIAAGIREYVAWVRRQGVDAQAWAAREVVRNW